MGEDVKSYAGKDVTVTWDRRLCIHVAECGRAANELFESGRDPWCQPDLVDSATALEVVKRCPTGALAFDGIEDETSNDVNRVVVANQGPLYLSGELNIAGAADDMPGVRFRAALCRCGLSKHKPFCDNSHESGDFSDRGAVGKAFEALDEHGGPLNITAVENGPLLLEGNLQIIAGTGRVAWEGSRCALCRCGASKNKPFCDGAHRKTGFTADALSSGEPE